MNSTNRWQKYREWVAVLILISKDLFLSIYSIINDLFAGGNQMGKGKSSKITSKAASRIQSHSDRTGKNQGFKARAQRAASKKK